MGSLPNDIGSSLGGVWLVWGRTPMVRRVGTEQTEHQTAEI